MFPETRGASAPHTTDGERTSVPQRLRPRGGGSTTWHVRCKGILSRAAGRWPVAGEPWRSQRRTLPFPITFLVRSHAVRSPVTPASRLPLLGALLLAVAAALVASLLPAGLALDRRVEAELRRAAMDDLGRAPMILEDRNAAREEALSMHAVTVAGVQGLEDAIRDGRFEEATRLAREAASMYGEEPVLVARDGRVVVGPGLDRGTVEALRRGESRVEYLFQDGVPRAVGLVALEGAEGWLGAAGSESRLDEALATTLAALARADVTLVGPDGSLVASTLPADSAAAVADEVLAGRVRARTDKVVEADVLGVPVWVATGAMGHVASVIFSRSVADELAALPGVRRGALLAGLLTLGLALGVGVLVAAAIARPVSQLAEAATRVSEGDFGAPVPHSRLVEVERLGAAFRTMRESLAGRLEDLAEANRELGERQRRLSSLQAELIRQDRLSSAARMAAELAHEIRNPVANVRNCLEVVRRGLPERSDEARFADMAIDELLRMHELAEHLLDLNRPADASVGSCDPETVASQVATLAGVGDEPVTVVVRSDIAHRARAAMPPDALKQVLFNLVQNAREAAGPRGIVEVRVASGNGSVRIDVVDEGPGIPDQAMARLFDPFFTTKDAVHGVGLGLFVAEGLARRYGGRMEARNRPDRGGALFRLEVPATEEAT